MMYVFTLCVCMYPFRQNRKERLRQKKWSHIEPHLIAPLDEKEVSLKVNSLINHLFPDQGSAAVFMMSQYTKMKMAGVTAACNYWLGQRGYP